MARTKTSLAVVRNPIARSRVVSLQPKFDDADDFLDALKTTVYSAAGAISPTDGLAIIDSASVAMAMTLADGTVTGERVLVILRSGTSAKVTPATMTGGTEVLLSGAGDRVCLIWTGAAWEHSGHAAGEGEFTSVAHGMVTGDGPFYIASTVTIPAGLAAFTPYWVIRLDNDKFQLAASSVLATAGTAISVTSAGAGTITLTKVIAITTIVNATDLLTAVAHGVPDETKVQVRIGTAGVLPTGLTAATDYWAIVAGDPNTFQLAASLVDAQADTEIDFSTDGTLPVNLLYVDFKTVSAVDFAS